MSHHRFERISSMTASQSFHLSSPILGIGSGQTRSNAWIASSSRQRTRDRLAVQGQIVEEAVDDSFRSEAQRFESLVQIGQVAQSATVDQILLGLPRIRARLAAYRQDVVGGISPCAWALHIAAPRDAILAVVRNHSTVGERTDNDWLAAFEWDTERQTIACLYESERNT